MFTKASFAKKKLYIMKKKVQLCSYIRYYCSFLLTDPLVQITIDESRNILYSRSEKGVIQVNRSYIHAHMHECTHINTHTTYTQAHPYT